MNEESNSRYFDWEFISESGSRQVRPVLGKSRQNRKDDEFLAFCLDDGGPIPQASLAFDRAASNLGLSLPDSQWRVCQLFAAAYAYVDLPEASGEAPLEALVQPANGWLRKDRVKVGEPSLCQGPINLQQAFVNLLASRFEPFTCGRWILK